MKKIIISVGLALVILVPLLFLCLKPKQTFDLAKDADIYVVKSHGVTAYQLAGDQLVELSSSSLPLVDDQVNHMVQHVNLDKRYLLFSDEDFPASINSKLVSMDFKTGTVKREPSHKTAYTSSGRSDRYYYTTDGEHLTAFDSDLNEKFSYHFDESVIAANFWGSGDKLYLNGAKAYQGDYEDFFLVFHEFEDHIELVEEDLFHYDKDKRYMFGDSYMLDGKLFSPVTGYRNRDTTEKWAGELIMEMDLDSREKTFYPLAYPGPYQSFLLGEQYIAFSHPYVVNGKLLLSLFDTKSKQSIPIDLEEQGVTFDDTFVRDIKQYDESTILILLSNRLLTYNIAEQRVLLNQEVNDGRQQMVALWVNR